jgi:3D-(3,5/4)-trihydroxycyclohexane-1,2-dione acylhydrolase (decyclizing)
VRFININVAGIDAAKHSGLALLADARVALEEVGAALAARGVRAPAPWTQRARDESAAFAGVVADLVSPTGSSPLRQAEIIGAVNDAAGETGVVVCAAGSLPGDLHKLWRARDPAGKGYHVEYGYSCMGYELPGAIGVKLAAPEREVFAMVGDGSWLMMPGELSTAVALGVPVIVVLIDNHGYASIGALSRSLGSAGFGTHYRRPVGDALPTDQPDGHDGGLAVSAEAVHADLALIAEGLGAQVIRAGDLEELRRALAGAKGAGGPVVIHVEADRYAGVPGFDSWWEVPPAEVSTDPAVAAARAAYEQARAGQRTHLRAP